MKSHLSFRWPRDRRHRHRPRRQSPLLFVLSLLCLACPWVSADDANSAKPDDRLTVDVVAGRTADDWVGELDSTDRTDRLRALRSLAPMGVSVAPQVGRCLEHDDAAMRYLACSILGDLGPEAVKPFSNTLKRMVKTDPMKSTQMAAAYALCRGGEMEQYLATLTDRLEYPERGMACCAAELIGRLGPDAKDAVPALQKAYRTHKPGGGGDYHIGGAAKNALRKLGAVD
ncbi:HEAT repeat domain-containing protein [Crateriforma spongiae]|uniref:HEAT repeat domain-containing protein n=1 Tax=Crateriforma spongiae TaxID=2724528 RepID=UPI0019826699|nr:HEAT repeat domain-containing protein [Crateriforma spongiae]